MSDRYNLRLDGFEQDVGLSLDPNQHFESIAYQSLILTCSAANIKLNFMR